MGTFIQDGDSQLPGVKADERPASVPPTSTEWAADDANKIREAARDLRAQVNTNTTAIALETSVRAAADAVNAAAIAQARLDFPAGAGGFGDGVYVTATGDTVSHTMSDWTATTKSEALKTAAMRMTHQPLEIPGALQARTIGLRGVLRNRRIASNDQEYWLSSSAYSSGLYFGDIYGAVDAFPGLFDAAKMREIIDLWAAGITVGTTTVIPAQWIATNDTYAYQVAGAYGPVIFDTAGWFAMWLALATERGDSTAWTTYGASATAALGDIPRDASGLLYSSPTLGWSCGIGYHDQVHLTGGLAAVSALFALAYTRLAITCNPVLKNQADAMIAALATLRRSDGYYSASTLYDYQDVWATACIAGNGLCSPEEAAASGARLAADYRNGLIAKRGGLRWLPYPEVWPVGICATTPFTYQNGGYWPGPWVWWAAKAMLQAGCKTEAANLMQDAVDETLRLHRYNGTAPWEWMGDDAGIGGTSGPYIAGTGFLPGVQEPTTQDTVVELPGAASSARIIPAPAHRLEAVEVVATASTTATIAVTAAPRYHPLAGDLTGQGFSSEGTIVPALALSSATSRYHSCGMKPVYPWGGYLKLALTSGSATHPLNIRLINRKVTRPRLVRKDLTSFTDAFATNSIDSYLRVVDVNWNVTGGYLNCARSKWGDACLAPRRLSDGYVEATITPLSIANQFPGLMFRWKDPWNYIFVQGGSASATVYDVVNGTSTSLGTVAVGLTNGVGTYFKIAAVGTALTVTVGATPGSFTTTVTGSGLAGAGLRCSIENIANASRWDDLTVAPAWTVQRDMVSDGLTPYTRTGTWTVSGNRLRSTDTANPLLALHADVTTNDIGVKGIFTSANWATKPAGLVVRAVSATNCIHATCNGTTVSVYDRNTTDTLLGTKTLTSSVSDGVDLEMWLRVVGSKITVRVGTDEWSFGAPRATASGSAGAYVRNPSSSAAEVSYSQLRVDGYTADDQPVPVGYVVDGGAFIAGFATDDRYAGVLGDVALRDESGLAVDSLAAADDVTVAY